MIDNNTRLILSLKKVKGIGNISIINSLKKFSKNTLSKINCDFNHLKDLNIRKINKYIDSGELTAIEWTKILKKTDDEAKNAAKKDISIITFLSKEYPINLRLISNSRFPALLYVKGNTNILNSEKSLAIIGTRNSSKNGKKLAINYAKYFVDKGYLIISGLALGTDTNAHLGTIDSNGKTIALLAAGLDQPIYPKQNTKLAEKILKSGGALVSEYPLGETLRPQYLAARDEWQSGMSDGVLAVETGISGGTKIAMGHSEKQGRPLAVPDMDKYLKMNIYNPNDSLNSKKNAVLKSSLPEKSQGTQFAILEGKAIPLFDENSFIEFREYMEKGHHYREKQFRDLNIKLNSKTTLKNITQTGLDL